MRLVRYSIVREMRSIYRILVGKPEKKISLGKILLK
jgi:hypothetical protein